MTLVVNHSVGLLTKSCEQAYRVDANGKEKNKISRNLDLALPHLASVRNAT